MALNYRKKALPIPRIYQLDYTTFMREYRNQRPVIIPDIVSTWSPITKWTPQYLTNVLKLNYEDRLQVFVSKDNKHFINHPDVTQLVTMSAQEFASHVFPDDLETAVDTADDDHTRYYLRTFSMPDVLFCDVDQQRQVDELLTLLVSKVKDSNGRHDQNEDKIPQCDGQNTDMFIEKETDMNMNIDKKTDETRAVWEDFLSPISLSDDDDVHVSDGVQEDHDVKKKLAEEVEVQKHTDSDGEVAENDDIHMRQTMFQEMHSRIFNCKTMQLWIGTRGNITPLHYDRNHGLLAQISGRKELVLFSHEDTAFLYPHPTYSDRAHTSRINLRRINESSYAALFSKLKEAQPYTCILKPGELLYMPPFWWHDVTSLDNCVSVTLPWDIDGYEEVPPCMLR
ncbi:uncharacterized protein [Amphiura filiformis]|uniref:uncharacterized protein n=1 Tax=Amphiura filiformis TaxID=82378 RepID=UPI003B2155B1